MSCNICVEPFNRSNRAIINCARCDFKSCRECNEKYLMSSKELSHCMNCKSDWDYRTLYSLFTKTFIQKKYKKHIEKILFDQERAMLPATQPFVEEKKMKNLLISQIVDIKFEILYGEHQNEEDLDILRVRKYELEERLKSLNVEKSVFIKKCTVQNCRGFLNSEWICGICKYQTCKDCHDVLFCDTNHKCNPENVETVKLLLKDSKGCPKCATPIFKIDGCDQMFCTLCYTAFSWNTGKIESGVIHNPHFKELQENQERNLLEIRCGREIDRNIADYLRNLTLNQSAMYIIALHTWKIRTQDLPKYANATINDNFDLRFKFLESTISEETFKSYLHKRHKQNSKNQEIAHILNMYTNCITEIVYRYIDKLQKTSNNVFINIGSIENEYLYEIYHLMEYTNENLKDLSIIYNTKLLRIDITGNFN